MVCARWTFASAAGERGVPAIWVVKLCSMEANLPAMAAATSSGFVDSSAVGTGSDTSSMSFILFSRSSMMGPSCSFTRSLLFSAAFARVKAFDKLPSMAAISLSTCRFFCNRTRKMSPVPLVEGLFSGTAELLDASASDFAAAGALGALGGLAAAGAP
eukprot:12008473-Alexandrium_andersonii.AAC.1